MEKKIVIYFNDNKDDNSKIGEPLSMEETNLLLFIRAMVYSEPYQLRHIISSLQSKLSINIVVEEGISNYPPCTDDTYPSEQQMAKDRSYSEQIKQQIKQMNYGGPAKNKY